MGLTALRFATLMLVFVTFPGESEQNQKPSNIERFSVADGLNSIAANLGNAFAAHLTSRYDFGLTGTIENFSKFPMRLRECKNGEGGGYGEVLDPMPSKIIPGSTEKHSMYGKSSYGLKHECTYVLVKKKCEGTDCSNDDYHDITLSFHLESEDEAKVGGKICKWAQQECKSDEKTHFKALNFCNADLGFCIEGHIANGKHSNVFHAVYPCSKAQFCADTSCRNIAMSYFEDMIKAFDGGEECLQKNN